MMWRIFTVAGMGTDMDMGTDMVMGARVKVRAIRRRKKFINILQLYEGQYKNNKYIFQY
jgi:hypothetical protein